MFMPILNRKSKGTIAERELIQMFWKHNWAAFRAAGSGASRFPCPDVIAGNSLRKIAIEAKYVDSERKYFTDKEIYELKEFSHIFGCEAWVGIKFQGKGWHFFSTEDLKETTAGYTIRLLDAELKGFTFEELIKTNIKM